MNTPTTSASTRNSNEKLFARVKAVYEQRQAEGLTAEQLKLVEETYEGFIRNGVNLQGADKAKYRELSQKLSLLTLQFSENNLKETNDYLLVLKDEAQLEGLPQTAIDAAAETAREKQTEGWAFTLQAPSFVPFMNYSTHRELRKELYMAYNTKCTHDNACNNLDIVKELANTRLAIAQLLGYKDYASYKLERRMAQNSGNVYHLLNQLLDAYKPTALQELAEVQALAKEEQGEDFTLMPWDWSYYSRKLQERKFNLNDEMLRPYFELDHVQEESRHPRLPQGRGGLRGVRQRRQLPGRALYGLLSPRRQTFGCLDDLLQGAMDRRGDG